MDDGIGNKTSITDFPSIMRVYYYSDGAVRVYEKNSNPGFLSAQKPMNADWAKVFAEYGQLKPAPTQWGLGQPDRGDTTRELGKMGIMVLRFHPQQQFEGNSFTQLLNLIFSLMQRKG